MKRRVKKVDSLTLEPGYRPQSLVQLNKEFISELSACEPIQKGPFVVEKCLDYNHKEHCFVYRVYPVVGGRGGFPILGKHITPFVKN